MGIEFIGVYYEKTFGLVAIYHCNQIVTVFV